VHIIPINEAEAILEPFWDGGSSEHPTDKRSLLSEYSVTIPDDVIGSVTQSWCAVVVSFQKAYPGATITMQRVCDLDVSKYDLFRLFASLPSWVRLEVRGVVDGEVRTLVGPQVGSDTNEEFEGPLVGGHITGTTLMFTLLEARPANMQILWTGLTNSARQREMEARQSPYTAEWKGLVVADPDVEAMKPQIGILFGSADLAALRRKLRDPAWSRAFAALKESLAGAMTWEPEREIGKYIAKPDRRWVRDRDMGKHCTAGVMESLAFVGLVEQDARYLRMAARMALSAAHCETWSESIVGSLPGTTWHHRSFTEEIYCRACGLVLDWAGCMLTPHARQLIADAIIMKGLPRIESDFKRMEYIRHMNQGIVFSFGRILGALAVLPLYPRYGSLIDDAERDLDEMISNYVHDDGGTLEGMAYWSYTFSSVMPIVWALARHREQALAEYATETLKKTGAYGLGMLSTIAEGASYLAINDAHIDGHYPAGLCAAYASLSGDPRWQALYRASLQAEDRRADIYQLIMAVDEETEPEIAGTALLEPRFSVFPDVGQVSSVRTLPAGTHEPGVPLSQADEGETEGGPRDVVHFHLCSGPTYGGHYHQDKGAFILDAGASPPETPLGAAAAPEVRFGGLQVRAVTADNALTLTVREEGVMGTYRCLGDRWVI